MSSTLNSLKLISDPTRIRILNLLIRESLSVAEMQEVMGMGQSRISSQLSQLKKGNLLNLNKSGKSNLYSATIPASLEPLILAAADEQSECAEDLEGLRYTLEKRKNKARAYFDQLAGKFGKEYVPGRSWKALAEGLIQVLNYKVVVDLGAGEGTLAQLIAQQAEQVIAVDHSPKMVEFGQKLVKEHKIENLDYRLGDIENAPLENESCDLAILSQALHHASSPQKALNEAFRILSTNGTLLILDLLQHSFENAKELYGDQWLGFSEMELKKMAEIAGFKSVNCSVVDKESEAPYFQTILLTAKK